MYVTMNIVSCIIINTYSCVVKAVSIKTRHTYRYTILTVYIVGSNIINYGKMWGMSLPHAWSIWGMSLPHGGAYVY